MEFYKKVTCLQIKKLTFYQSELVILNLAENFINKFLAQTKVVKKEIFQKVDDLNKCLLKELVKCHCIATLSIIN